MPDNDAPQGSWHPDPTGRFKLRWQRSTGEWSHHVHDHDGNPHTDPYYAPESEKPRKKRKIWRWVLILWGGSAVLLVVLAAVGALTELEPESATTRPSSTTTRRPAATTTARTLSAKEVFEDCVSAWDGNHDGLEALIRAQLNDPGSMETHGTYYNPSDSLTDGSITIRLDYGARNALGGMVRTNAYADMGTNCDIIRVIDYGF